MPNITVRKKKQLSIFRRMSMGTWKTVGDPSVYGSVTLRMDKAMEYLADFRERTGKRLTISHMAARAMAAVLEEMPDANALIRLGGIYLRKDIDVFFQVVMKDKTGRFDLSGTVVRKANTKSLAEIVDEMEKQVVSVKEGSDKELERTRKSFRFVPLWAMRWILNTISFFTYTLNLNLQKLGIPKDPLGSLAITNIGSLGLEEAYVPLIPYSRIPLLLALSAVKDVPIVQDGVIVPGKEMRVCATFDHRIMDGAHAARMTQVLRAWFENPYEHFDPLP